MKEPTLGDRVAFSRAFLQSTAQYTGPEAPCSYGPFARGVVVELHPFASVRWDNGREVRVNVRNLVCVNELHKEAS